MELTTSEKRVLTVMRKAGKASPAELGESSGISVDAAVQAAFMLAEKRLVSVSEKTLRSAALTAEGEKYASEGLPERQLLAALGEGATVEVVKAKYGDKFAGIAMGWLRRKGWAEICDGRLIPKGSCAEGADERILAALRYGPADASALNAQALRELIKRNLAVIKEEKLRSFAITDEGMRLPESEIAIEEEVAELTPQLIRSGAWKQKKLRPYDIRIAPEPVYGGKIHPYQRLMDEMRRIFLEMGFTEIKGEIVQSSFWNFDALFQPQDHPAREMQDTFYLDSRSGLPPVFEDVKNAHLTGGNTGSTGWGGTWSEEVAQRDVLRTHTTAITIKYLADHPEPPVKAFCIDRVYRREAIDPTHTPEFEQLEGVVMDRGVGFRHLLGYLREFYHRMGFKDVRFRPGYFPYTEPSVEPEVYIESRGKWVELGGAGVFRKEVTAPLGIKAPVLAWGLGVSRLAMLRLGLKDLRELYQSDIDWLRKSPVAGP